jgi:TonB family protein
MDTLVRPALWKLKMFNTERYLLIVLTLVLLCPSCAGKNQISSDINSKPVTHNVVTTDSSWANIAMVRFKQVWQIPQDHRISPDMNVTYTIKISQSGEIISKKMLVSSGNKAYDRSVETALNNIKLPPAPDGKYEWTITFFPPYSN